jgi:transposase InsO family protein
VNIRSDNNKEFDNTDIHEYCDEVGIKQEFLATYTPHKNGVVERNNRTLITLARTIIDEYNTSERFWDEAIRSTQPVMHQISYFLIGCLRRLHVNCSIGKARYLRLPVHTHQSSKHI